MKILWTHTFNPNNPFAGIFMLRHIESLKKEGIIIEPIYLGRIRNIYKLVKAINLINSKLNDFDLIHAQYGSTCGLASTFNNKRKILSLKGSDWYRLKTNNFKVNLHSFLSNKFTRFSLANYDSIIAMSHHMKYSVQKEIKNVPSINVIPDPIDLDLFHPTPLQEARKKFFNTTDLNPWILFISIDKNNPVKRYYLAKESIDYAKKFIPNLQFKVTEKVSPELMPGYLSCFNMVISTSLFEGWPNNIKEALALSIPFVATNISDLSGIASRNKSCFVTPSNPADLGSAIVKCLSNNSNVNENLREEVLEMSMEKINSKYIQLYKQVISK